MTPVMARAMRPTPTYQLKPTTIEQYRTRRIKEINQQLSELRRLRAFGEIDPKKADERIKSLTAYLTELEG